MDSKKLPRKPKHERRDALKLFNYDAVSSVSSFDSSSYSSVYACSTELNDRTSFRIDGIEGEFDRICRSLGLSGPEDFAIPAAAWEAMKFRPSLDTLPSLKIEEIDLQQKEEDELSEKCEDRDRDSVRVTEEEDDSSSTATEPTSNRGKSNMDKLLKWSMIDQHYNEYEFYKIPSNSVL